MRRESPAISPAGCPVVLPWNWGGRQATLLLYPFQATVFRTLGMKAGVVFALSISHKATINKTMF